MLLGRLFSNINRLSEGIKISAVDLHFGLTPPDIEWAGIGYALPRNIFYLLFYFHNLRLDFRRIAFLFFIYENLQLLVVFDGTN